MENEVWKDVPEYKGIYQVSNLGRVKSLSRLINNGRGKHLSKEKMLKCTIRKNHYLQTKLYKNSKSKTYLIHQLVAICFLNHKIGDKNIVVDHIDFNRSNNKVDNLRVISNRINCSETSRKRTSKYIGVHWRSDRNKWKCLLINNNKSYYLGLFENEYDAHLAYQEKLKTV